jgi:hypothetical protein
MAVTLGQAINKALHDAMVKPLVEPLLTRGSAA